MSDNDVRRLWCYTNPPRDLIPLDVPGSTVMGTIKELIHTKLSLDFHACELALFKPTRPIGIKSSNYEDVLAAAGPAALSLASGVEVTRLSNAATVSELFPEDELVPGLHIGFMKESDIPTPLRTCHPGKQRLDETEDEGFKLPIFYTNSREFQEEDSLLWWNMIFPHSSRDKLPEFIDKILISLAEKRCIPQLLRAYLAETLKEDFEKYFTVSDKGSAYGTAELGNYLSVCAKSSFGAGGPTLLFYKGKHKEGIILGYLGNVMMYLSLIYPEGEFCNGMNWSFPLVANFMGQYGSERYRYTPRSDFLFSLHGCPCMFTEFQSEEEQGDRYRMLVQAGVLVRVMNSVKDCDEEPFVAFAIYFDIHFRATRYLVYQNKLDDEKVYYLEKEFRLYEPTQAVAFFVELYNFPSVMGHNNARIIAARDYLQQILVEVHKRRYPGFTGTTGTGTPWKKSRNNGETTKSQCGNLSAAGSGDSEMRCVYDMPSVAERLSNEGYQLVREKHIEGWVLLNPLKPTLSKAKKLSTGEAVILKLIDPSELAIHKFLISIKSCSNHTIPLLGEVALDIGTIIAMPLRLILPYAPDSLLKNSGDDLMSQFLEGVQFMHQQNVAHLDLKPDNIVIQHNLQEPRLFIIDFNISVHVAEREALIEGYRGTCGWVAPEVGDEDGPEQSYSPIRADLWSSGLMLKYFIRHQSNSINREFQSIADMLLHRDPLERPLLTEVEMPSRPKVQEPEKKKRRVDGGEHL